MPRATITGSDPRSPARVCPCLQSIQLRSARGVINSGNRRRNPSPRCDHAVQQCRLGPLLRKIVGDFVQRVIKAQRVWRDYMACRQGRLLALSRKWDSIDTPPADAPTFKPDPRRFARRKANRRSAHMPVGLDAPSDESGDSVFLTQRQNWAEPRCVGVNRGLQRGR